MLARHYSDIILFSVEPTATGSIDTRRFDNQGFAMARKLKLAGVKRVFLSVGGSQRSKNFREVAASHAKRKALIAALAGLCKAKGLDGVDYDWEHPRTPEEQSDYGKLIVETRQALAPHKLLLSVAVPTWQEMDPVVLAAVDRINLMTYDAPGEHATYQFATQSVADWIAKGARAGQICLGVPFYGRGVSNHHSAMAYASLAANCELDPHADIKGDYYYNGTAMLGKKAAFARQRGLAGIMVWEVGQDTPEGTLAAALRP
jgi:chitinase